MASKIDCPACGYRNNAGADLCENCGEPLSIVAGILDRQGSVGRPLWIRRLQTQVTKLKATEAEASHARMAEFEEIDRKRMQAEAEAQLIQQAKDRQILYYGALGVLGFLLVVMIIYALTAIFT